MSKRTVKKSDVGTIAETIHRLSDLEAARLELAFAVGAAVEVSGTVQKVVKGGGKLQIIITTGDVPGFVVYADFSDKELTSINPSKMRKGAPVSVGGKRLSFGASAVNLSACRLIGDAAADN